ncbi:DUF3558 domain-containing protein [Nocardia sp. CA2R105]|uniref:DUF3558 domain-containing protein n=1 Tax=Nocardia coffeae TaxID=2873381 RepID=UPI001CA68886|nr:DUF3558 domain-containing protein [Nocardia coffeae]MBY8857518.1 DUF3558 domain-containing protein [Nocardia coffeae]
MTDWGRVIRCAAAGVGAAALLAGCNSEGGGTSNASSSAAAATSTIAPTAPSAFNACELSQSVADANHIDSGAIPADSTDPTSGAAWKGCVYSTYDGDGYGTTIRTTNLTIPLIKANKKFNNFEQLTVGGRQAITYHEADLTDLRADCILNVEMKGGGLEILVTNPASHKATGTQDSCEIAKKLAGDLVPTFPASV